MPVLNVPGVLDEACMLGYTLHSVGMHKALDWGSVMWDDFLLPWTCRAMNIPEGRQGRYKLLDVADHSGVRGGAAPSKPKSKAE